MKPGASARTSPPRPRPAPEHKGTTIGPDEGSFFSTPAGRTSGRSRHQRGSVRPASPAFLCSRWRSSPAPMNIPLATWQTTPGRFVGELIPSRLHGQSTRLYGPPTGVAPLAIAAFDDGAMAVVEIPDAFVFGAELLVFGVARPARPLLFAARSSSLARSRVLRTGSIPIRFPTGFRQTRRSSVLRSRAGGGATALLGVDSVDSDSTQPVRRAARRARLPLAQSRRRSIPSQPPPSP